MSLMVLASVSASSFIQTVRSQIIVHCPNGPCSLKTQFFVMEIFEKIQPID